jgi:predicted transcriptional regulator
MSIRPAEETSEGTVEMTERAILLTIKQSFANRILDGSQVVEHRTRPPRISKPTRAIMYVSGVKELVGEFTMGPVGGEPDRLGYPLPVRNPVRYPQPKSWKWVCEQIPGIRRPQRSYRYLDPANAADARLLEMLGP